MSGLGTLGALAAIEPKFIDDAQIWARVIAQTRGQGLAAREAVRSESNSAEVRYGTR